MKSKITEIQKIYRDIKDVYKKIINLKPFEKYGRNDCFHFMDENTQGMTLFSDSVWKGNPGIQLFMGKNGLNHVHDLVTCPHSYGYDRAFANISALSYVGKADIEETDRKFLKKMGCNVTNNNLLIFELKEGRGFVDPTKSDLVNILYYLNLYLQPLTGLVRGFLCINKNIIKSFKIVQRG